MNVIIIIIIIIIRLENLAESRGARSWVGSDGRRGQRWAAARSIIIIVVV